MWSNTAGGGGAMTDLTDVSISGATGSQVLAYDSATAEWKNRDDTWERHRPHATGLPMSPHAIQISEATPQIANPHLLPRMLMTAPIMDRIVAVHSTTCGVIIVPDSYRLTP